MYRQTQTPASFPGPALRAPYGAVPQTVRSRGEIDLGFARRAGGTHLLRSYQAGCLRVRLPRRSEGGRPCAVILNTSGGLAEGDRLTQRVAWEAGTIGTVTTQAAEKVYRALSEGSAIETRIDVAPGAEAEWLPQETILFDRAMLRRNARIMLAEDVTFLGLEAIVLGRAAMGEQVREGLLRDTTRIYRNGRLIYADALALEGDIAALMKRAAIGNGARAMAVIIHASPAAAGLRDPLRAELEESQGLAAASLWNGLLVTRMLAADGATLRRDLVRALGVLRGGRPLPRVWNC